MQRRERRLPEPAGFVSILTRPGGRVQRVRSLGCAATFLRFNPHPSRRTGATRPLRTSSMNRLKVSILTRPGGRVQRRRFFRRAVLRPGSFNPHPSRRTGATERARATGEAAGSFNPHPSRRTGATKWSASSPLRPAKFQSSPVPEDGCNSSEPKSTRCPR